MNWYDSTLILSVSLLQMRPVCHQQKVCPSDHTVLLCFWLVVQHFWLNLFNLSIGVRLEHFTDPTMVLSPMIKPRRKWTNRLTTNTNHSANDVFSNKKWCSLWPSDAIWRQRSGSTLDQVMACCLTAPSLYLYKCWLNISEVQWQLPENNLTSDISTINH